MDALVQLVYEIGLLKRIRRTGWWVAGLNDAESVAEHSFRTAVLGFILATLEGTDPYRTAALCLFHDLPETRVGDLHRINRRYLDQGAAEHRALEDQVENLPPEVGSKIQSLCEETQNGETLEAKLARDADLLECLVQAREYQAQGCSSVTDWIRNTYAHLRSPAAQRLAEACMRMDPKQWWHELKVKEPS